MSKGHHNPKPDNTACRVLGHVWIEGPEGALLGIGRVALLEQIRANGSISAAARAMGMSYRHAWELIDSMNRQLGVPLVIKATGGRGGGGTRLTATAEQAIATFHELDGAFREFMKQRTQLLSLETAPINDNQETGLE